MTDHRIRPQPLVLLHVPDVFTQTRVADAVRLLQARPYIRERDESLFRRVPDAPLLVIVDLSAPDWEKVVQDVRRHLRHVPIVAFGPHVDREALERARRLGCRRVLARGKFLRSPQIQIAPYLKRPHTLEGCEDAPDALTRQGIEAFNRGQYYECHELLESAWRADPRPCREMLQAILQLGVTLYHLGRGNRRGARRVLLRALGKFTILPDRCQNIDLAALHAYAYRLLHALQEGKDAPDPPDISI